MPTVSIIVPTLNEEQNIHPLLERIERLSMADVSIQVLFVDDSSTDGTVKAIRSWHDTSWVDVLERSGKPDLTRSVIEGVAHCNSDIVLVMDADLSHPVEKIPELLQPILNDSHDLTVGSRYVKGGGSDDWPWHRRILSWAGGLLSRGLSDVKDTTSGFFACKKTCFEGLDKGAAGYKILLEVLVKGIDQLRVAEIPIRFTDRIYGSSKLSSHQMIEYLRRIVALSGGSASITTASRFALVGTSGVVVDFGVFLLLIGSDVEAGNAHIFSFLAAFLSNYLLNSIWTFRYDHVHRRSWIIRGIKYLLIAVLALTLRGGILNLFIDLFEWPPMLAIFPAIAAAMAVNYAGVSYYVFGTSQDRITTPIGWRVIAVGIVLFMLMLKLAYLGTAQLLPDEAYYWNYQQFMALSFLDHPPMVAWLIWLGTQLFGDNEFGVRILGFLCGIGTLAFIFSLARNLYGATTAFISLLLASVLPFTAALSGFFMTTDSPSLLAWSGALYFAERALIAQHKNAWWGLGLMFGIGLLSKYSIVLLGLAMFIFMLSQSSTRIWFRRIQPYGATLLILLIASPVLIWNYQHDWISFGFQTVRRMSLEQPFSLQYLLLHLFIMLTPLGLWGLVCTVHTHPGAPCRSHIRSTEQIQQQRKLLWLSIGVPFFVFVLFSFQHYPRFHWTAPVWIGLLPLLGEYLRSISTTAIKSPALAVWTKRTALALCILYGAIFHYATLGLPLIPYGGFMDHYFWKQAAVHTHELEQEMETKYGQKPVIIGLSKWSVASVLRFYDVDGHRDNILSRNAVGRSAAMFDFWTTPAQWAGHPVLFIANDSEDLDSAEVRGSASDLSIPVSEAIITATGKKMRYLHYRMAGSYSPMNVHP